MKKLNALGFATLLVAGSIFTSCDKEQLKDSVGAVQSEVEENVIGSEALVLNMIANEDLADLSLHMDGISFASGLDYKDLTNYLEIETGEVLLDLVSKDGSVIASSSYMFQKDEMYNIVLVADENGASPQIKVMGIDPSDFEHSDSFSSELGYTDELLNTYSVNVINYMVAVEGQNVMLGIDYLGNANTEITGLLGLGHETKSGTFVGSDELIEQVNVLTSSLDVDGVLADLNEKSGGLLDVLELADAHGIGEIVTGGPVGGLLGDTQSLLDGILGDAESTLEMVKADLLSADQFVPDHDYTIVITGAGQTIDAAVIDQTIAGLK